MDVTEIIGLLAATLTTAAYVPQVFKAWKNKSTKDISWAMYFVMFVGVMLWLYYGMAIGSLPVVLANAVTGILIVFVIILKSKYR
ncbi:SemiSWEET family sugar transporter [Flagellimonas onchidii]|uniref:SemiSWEET family sugar transporter n=1 Tax=Flagellimonas onchidii TaxID=2562684 RepID=UPI0010A6AF18|nr:SemiSWEET transporter [Allomuricauda onchidii]